MEKICCIKGCEKEVLAMGLCTKHWRRNRLYGSPVAVKSLSGILRGVPAPDRFKRQRRVLEDGCWKWTGCVDKDGYGSFRGIVNDVPHSSAHRYSYALHKGSIPENMMVCHTCDRPWCVNPDHLFLGTGKDNQQDKHRKGRANVAFGERVPHAKLTELQAIAVLHDPRPYAEIASEYNIAPSTVGSLKQRISWKHIS